MNTEIVRCQTCGKEVEFEVVYCRALKDFGTDPRMNGWIRWQRYEDCCKGIYLPWFCSKECLLKDMENK